MASHWQHRVLQVSYPGTPAECPLHQVTYSWPAPAPASAQCGDASRGPCGESPEDELQESTDSGVPRETTEVMNSRGNLGQLGNSRDNLGECRHSRDKAGEPSIAGDRIAAKGRERSPPSTLKGESVKEREGSTLKGGPVRERRGEEGRSVGGCGRPCWTWHCEVGLIRGRGIELRQAHCVHWDHLLLLLLGLPWRLLAALCGLLLWLPSRALGTGARRQELAKATRSVEVFSQEAHANGMPVAAHSHSQPANSEHSRDRSDSCPAGSEHRREGSDSWPAGSERRRELWKSRFLVQRQFIPWDHIQAAVITEHVTPSTCYFSLQLLLKDVPEGGAPPAGNPPDGLAAGSKEESQAAGSQSESRGVRKERPMPRDLVPLFEARIPPLRILVALRRAIQAFVKD